MKRKLAARRCETKALRSIRILWPSSFFVILVGCPGFDTSKQQVELGAKGQQNVEFSPLTGLPSDFPIPDFLKFLNKTERSEFGGKSFSVKFETNRSGSSLVDFYLDHSDKSGSAWFVNRIEGGEIVIYQHPDGKLPIGSDRATTDPRSRIYTVYIASNANGLESPPLWVEIYSSALQDPLRSF